MMRGKEKKNSFENDFSVFFSSLAQSHNKLKSNIDKLYFRCVRKKSVYRFR